MIPESVHIFGAASIATFPRCQQTQIRLARREWLIGLEMGSIGCLDALGTITAPFSTGSPWPTSHLPRVSLEKGERHEVPSRVTRGRVSTIL